MKTRQEKERAKGKGRLGNSYGGRLGARASLCGGHSRASSARATQLAIEQGSSESFQPSRLLTSAGFLQKLEAILLVGGVRERRLITQRCNYIIESICQCMYIKYYRTRFLMNTYHISRLYIDNAMSMDTWAKR